MALTPKRKRHVLTIEQKIEIIERLEKGETPTCIAQLYNVGKSTVTDIKNNKATLLKFVSDIDSDSSIRKKQTIKSVENAKYEESVCRWYLEKQRLEEPNSDYNLSQRSALFREKLGSSSDLKANNERLKTSESQGSGDVKIERDEFADEPTATSLKISLQEFSERYKHSKGVYNTDERGNWQALPHKTHIPHREAEDPGFKGTDAPQVWSSNNKKLDELNETYILPHENYQSVSSKELEQVQNEASPSEKCSTDQVKTPTINDQIEITISNPEKPSESVPEPVLPPSKKKRTMCAISEQSAILARALDKLIAESQLEHDPFEIYGRFVASELRSIKNVDILDSVKLEIQCAIHNGRKRDRSMQP